MKTRVTVGPLPAAQFGRSLRYLLDYPTDVLSRRRREPSRFSTRDLAKMSADARDDLNGVDVDVDVDVRERWDRAPLVSVVSPQEGLATGLAARLATLGARSHGTHFLVEAQKAGLRSMRPRSMGCSLTRNQMANGLSFTSHGRSGPELRDRAMRSVLALAGRSNQNALHYAASEGLSP